MSLNFYLRHRCECVGGHAHNSFSSELDEHRKAWKRCECPIVVSGTLRKRFRRHSTGQWGWAPAKAMAAQFETVKSWTAQVDVLLPATPDETTITRITIEPPAPAFLDIHKAASALGTLRANTYFLNTRFAYVAVSRVHMTLSSTQIVLRRSLRASRTM